nr:ATP-binding protein [Curtobacterium flaccumfaciens]
MAQPIIGRERETAALRHAIRDVAGGGSAFVIDGEAGIGKSSLVADVLQYANSLGVRTITTTGTLAEAAEPYAALHMLLYPLRAGITNLPAPQRRALDVAFGVVTGVQPSPLLAGLAALTLLSDAAAERPLLVVAEDLHWMDASSEWALRMMARRVGEDPVVILMTTRNSDMVETPGIQRLHLGPLDESAADELLDGISGAPTGPARRDLVLRAEGNPLALHELGRSAATADRTRDRPVVGRVEQEFAARYAEARPVRPVGDTRRGAVRRHQPRGGGSRRCPCHRQVPDADLDRAGLGVVAPRVDATASDPVPTPTRAVGGPPGGFAVGTRRGSAVARARTPGRPGADDLVARRTRHRTRRRTRRRDRRAG